MPADGLVSAQETAPGSRKKTIVLVHGTWSPNAPWIQAGSTFRKAIEERCPGWEMAEPFVWSGDNTAIAREKAADDLRCMMGKYPDRSYVLIGHSHGGNIALQSLKECAGGEPVEDMVRGVVSINTPFITLLRKDTQNLSEFVLVSTMLFISFLFWISFFIETRWVFWPVLPAGALVIFSLLIKYFDGIIVRAWINRKWLKYKERFVQPDVQSTPFLCINCGADEAFTVLSVVDGISSLPSLLTMRYLVGSVSLYIFCGLLALREISTYTGSFGANVSAAIAKSPLGFVLNVFRIPDLESFGIGLSPHYRFLSVPLEILGLGAIYSSIFYFLVVILMIAAGSFSRAATGTWGERLLPLFGRQLVSLTPPSCKNVSFYQFDFADGETPLHSISHDDPQVIDRIVGWINELR